MRRLRLGVRMHAEIASFRLAIAIGGSIDGAERAQTAAAE